MLFALAIGGSQILMFALAALAAAGGTAFLLKKDSGIEERRRQAIDLSSNLDSIGLDVLSNVVKDYAVGDYGGLLTSFRTLFRELKTPDALLARLQKNFKAQLRTRLENPEERAAIIAAVRPYIEAEEE